MALSRREALMQQGMQNIFGGIQTMDAAKKAEEENRRRFALQGLEYATGLQKEGFDVSPEAQMQISGAFGTGDVGGLASLRSQLPLTDVESKKRLTDAKAQELSVKKSLADIDKTTAEARKLAAEVSAMGKPDLEKISSRKKSKKK
jgi:hypothetical protein